MSVDDFLPAVEVAFISTSAGMAQWTNPHPMGSPNDDEYSRVTNPERFRIIGARVDAWIEVLTVTGLADLETDCVVDWGDGCGARLTRTDRLVPRASGALVVVLGRSEIAGVADAGIALGVGDPAELVSLLPRCGCDACDDGSQQELDELDGWFRGFTSGSFRRLRRGESTITVRVDGVTTSGPTRHRQTAQALADPRGWEEISGDPWTQ